MPPDEQKKFLSEAEKMFDTAKQRHITIHFMVAGVRHVMYALLKADNFNALNNFVGGFPFKQDLQVEPVGNIKDVIPAFKEEVKKS